MDFNLIEYKMFINVASDFIFQLTSKKLQFAEFQYSIKEEHPQLFENAIVILLCYQLLTCMKLDFLHTLQPKQQTECKRPNGEASERIQLPSNKLDTEEIS